MRYSWVCFSMEVELILRFRRRKSWALYRPLCRLYFSILNLVWLLDQHSWFLLMTRMITMEGMQCKVDRIFVSSERQDVTFVWMKNHFPFPFSYCKFVKIVLQRLYISSGFYSHVYNVVVWKSRMVKLRPTDISFI